MRTTITTSIVQLLYKILRKSFSAGKASTGPVDFSNRKITLYIHFPFCDTICRYCPFSRTIANDDVDVYMQSLLRELQELKSMGKLEDTEVTSMAFGGGTPSLIPDQYLRELMHLLSDTFPSFNRIQKTMECTPESITKERLQLFAEMGIDRLSIGVQSLQGAVLSELGRDSSAELIQEKLAIVKDVWKGTWSCDLIYGFVSHSRGQFLDDLKNLADSGADHLTIFPLVNCDTNNKQYLKPRQFSRLRGMYHAANELLQKLGYDGYSVEDYTRSEEAVLNYQKESWQYPQIDTLILGSGGFGICNGVQYRKSKSRKEYLSKIDAGEFPIDKYLPINPKREKLVRRLLGLHFNTIPVSSGLKIYPILWLSGIAYKHEGFICLTEYGRFVTSLLWAKIMVDRMGE